MTQRRQQQWQNNSQQQQLPTGQNQQQNTQVQKQQRDPFTKLQHEVQMDYCRREGWIMNRQGKEFMTFKGLLWMAHQQGLTSIISTPVHEDYENAFFAFRAEARGFKEINGEMREVVFADEGDATLKNVGKMIHPHLRRMASTRAMVRALRIYTGVGMTAFEELGD